MYKLWDVIEDEGRRIQEREKEKRDQREGSMGSLSGSAVTSRHQTTWASLRLLINTDQLLLFTPSIVEDNTQAKDSPAPPSVRL